MQSCSAHAQEATIHLTAGDWMDLCSDLIHPPRLEDSPGLNSIDLQTHSRD